MPAAGWLSIEHTYLCLPFVVITSALKSAYDVGLYALFRKPTH